MLKEFYINLDRCPWKREHMEKHFPRATRVPAVDGRVETVESILPYWADREWRDPNWNRRLTQGEIGCILSHIEVWKKVVKLNEPVIILEDDIDIVEEDYNLLVETQLLEHDFVYLGKRPVEDSIEPIEINETLETPGFCYWTCGYAINPAVAEAYLNYFKDNPLIPADEIVPMAIGKQRNPSLQAKWNSKIFSSVAWKKDIVTPRSIAYSETDTEVPEEIFPNYEFNIITVGDNVEKVKPLMESTTYPIRNIGEGVVWKGGTMEGPGGGQKINMMKEELKNYQDQDIIMFVDGFDCFINANIDDILKRYFSFRKELVFSAEKLCWPDQGIADQFPETGGYKYLNSGTYIGTVGALKILFEKDIEDHADDQLYVQLEYLSNKHDMVLDWESYIFFCLSGIEDSIAVNEWNQLVNTETNCTSCVLHGNGGEYTKEVYWKYVHDLQDSQYAFYVPKYMQKDVEYIDKDMILIKNLLSPEFCSDLIEECNFIGGWEPLPNDKFPAQEIRLRYMDKQKFYKAFEKAYYDKIEHITEGYWAALKMYGIRDLFAMKYSLDTQTKLNLHHDMSLVSGSMKLNNDFKGAFLNFPRQNITNLEHDIGSMVLWPASVSHPHECTELKSGTKYSLTLWSSREEGDVY